jgi:hypothetical protein
MSSGYGGLVLLSVLNPLDMALLCLLGLLCPDPISSDFEEEE